MSSSKWGNPGSRLLVVNAHLVDDTQSGYLVSPSHDISGLYWTVSVPVKGTAVPVERLGAYALVVRHKRCPTSSNPALLPSRMAVCPSCTLQMLLLLPSCPIMDLNSVLIARRRNQKISYTTGTIPTSMTVVSQAQALLWYRCQLGRREVLTGWQQRTASRLPEPYTQRHTSIAAEWKHVCSKCWELIQCQRERKRHSINQAKCVMYFIPAQISTGHLPLHARYKCNLRPASVCWEWFRRLSYTFIATRIYKPSSLQCKTLLTRSCS